MACQRATAVRAIAGQPSRKGERPIVSRLFNRLTLGGRVIVAALAMAALGSGVVASAAPLTASAATPSDQAKSGADMICAAPYLVAAVRARHD